MTNYKLFIDDEREMTDAMRNDPKWITARSYKHAIMAMEKHGCPSFISFDHDLGTQETGFDIANWMVNKDLNSDGGFIPEDFEFTIHSQNPIGGDKIRNLLERFLMFRKS